MHKHRIVTNGKQSWSRVCKQHHSLYKQLPHEHHNLYRIWLLTKPIERGEQELHVEDLPKSVCLGRAFLKEGLQLPYPSGPHWQRLIGDHTYSKSHSNRVHDDDIEEEQTYAALRLYRQWLDRDIVGLAMLCRAAVAE